MNFSCYPFWLLFLALFLCLCERSLASPPPTPTHRGVDKHNSIPPCLVFSSAGGSGADLSTVSPCLPHSQEKRTAASPIVLTAPSPVGPLCWSGWEHKWVGTSQLSCTISHGQVSAKQLSSLITSIHPSPAPRNVCVTAWSQRQSTGLSLVRAEQELPSQERLRAQAGTLQSAGLSCSQVNRHRTESRCARHWGEVPEPAPDTSGTNTHGPSCSWLPCVLAKALGSNPVPFPSSSHHG